MHAHGHAAAAALGWTPASKHLCSSSTRTHHTAAVQCSEGHRCFCTMGCVCVRARICIHDHAGDSRDSNGSSSSCQWPANQAQTTAGAHTAPRRGLWIALLCAAQRTTHARHSRACGHTQRSRVKQQQWLHPQPSTFACTRSVWLHTRTAVLARHPHAVSQLISAE
jgi:hypothetical protein